MAARAKDQVFQPTMEAARWSDWEVASMCLVSGLVQVVTKKGVTHTLLEEWRRAHGAFCDATMAGGPTTRQRRRLLTLTEKIRRGFAEVAAESA